MKNKPLTLVLLLISFWGYGQQYKSIDNIKYRCDYQLTYQPDSTNKKSTATENMLLLVGDSSSIFYSKSEYLKDSIYIANQIWNLVPSEKIAIAAITPKSIFKYKIIKKQQSQKVIFNENIYIDTFEYEESLNQFKWEIIDTTKLILGFYCQKATTHFGGRSYEAWFSNELPINNGPYKFNGLPGLIVSINDTKKQYQFLLVAFKSVQNEKIFVPKTKIFRIDKKQFNVKKLEYTMSPFKTIGQNNNTITFTTGGSELSAQEMDKLVQAELKKNNNPIELK